MDEQNIRGLGLTGNDDDFLLQRTRLFVNAKYGDGSASMPSTSTPKATTRTSRRG